MLLLMGVEIVGACGDVGGIVDCDDGGGSSAGFGGAAGVDGDGVAGLVTALVLLSPSTPPLLSGDLGAGETPCATASFILVVVFASAADKPAAAETEP